ncbi:MAG: hypothetical protein PHX04_05670 [Bacilli bacterium]|nr:hypothetical protein [Bacilli bacterium]
MLLKALDLLRVICWGVIDFIYSLIDSIFEIIGKMNTFNIIDSLAENSIFKNLHSSIMIIAITLFGLFVVWKFVVKVMEPDEGLSVSQIFNEVWKCGAFIILSTFLFSQVATFSIQLSGFTANIFKNNNTELSNSMLELYIDFSDGYKLNDDADLDYEKLQSSINDHSFTNAKIYNNKYVTNQKWILPDEQDYVYTINWIMAILIGGFFLYSLFFSGMMLARRQIEFLFLFVISPIVFASSVGNKQRRQAVIEQLVSLTLQAAVVMLIINITALIMQAVNNTTFFTNGFQDIVIKSLMFVGCGSFLLTGSQVVNRFIGGNVSANSGREQMMSLMGFGQTVGAIGSAGSLATAGASMVGVGAITKGMGGFGTNTNKAMSGIGGMLSGFGNKLSSNGIKNNSIASIGSAISSYGSNMQTKANNRLNIKNEDGLIIPKTPNKLNRFGNQMMLSGQDNLQSAIDTIIPNRNMYRRRSRYRDD